MDDDENCPVCNRSFNVLELISHVERCKGDEDEMDSEQEKDSDYELALKLQQEEDKNSRSKEKKPDPPKLTKTQSQLDEEFAKKLAEQDKEKEPSNLVKCQQCGNSIKLDDIYILDECTHKFCKDCIHNYVAEMISKTVKLECPLKGCGKDLSVRDMKDLLPKIQKKSKEGSPLNPSGGSGKATERIMAEFKHIMKSEPDKNGYSVNPVEDNIYKWELKLFNFEKTDLLAQDMTASKVKKILLHIIFPKSYPFSPPYIRVIKPRFQYRTGHVTIGGSICMELLTNKGWSPANTIEAIIVSIRAQLVAGGARLDPSNKHDYTEQEAKDAFDRMVRDHGWF